MARPKRSDYNPKDAMLKEFQESARLAQILRNLIQTQIDATIAGITSQTPPRDRIEIVEQLADIYAKQIKAMETTWKGLVAKDGSIAERDPSLQELLDLTRKG